MIQEYAIHGVFIAAAPLTAMLAVGITYLLHSGLIALRFYRWVWHPVLFDTAMFVAVWALITFHPLPLPQGLLP
ncbi:DUF1656 domain-containing protein [Novosphingobium sp.]|uniref:DUF1656 domain-containing protein n=1 Tax=Novosphingobium sp. TaxID=1874826 RepID=UPI003B51E27E